MLEEAAAEHSSSSLIQLPNGGACLCSELQAHFLATWVRTARRSNVCMCLCGTARRSCIVVIRPKTRRRKSRLISSVQQQVNGRVCKADNRRSGEDSQVFPEKHRRLRWPGKDFPEHDRVYMYYYYNFKEEELRKTSASVELQLLSSSVSIFFFLQRRTAICSTRTTQLQVPQAFSRGMDPWL